MVESEEEEMMTMMGGGGRVGDEVIPLNIEVIPDSSVKMKR